MCFNPIDLDDACECLECEVALCKTDYESISGKDQPCPNCQSTDGFKKKLSRDHKAKIAAL